MCASRYSFFLPIKSRIITNLTENGVPRAENSKGRVEMFGAMKYQILTLFKMCVWCKGENGKNWSLFKKTNKVREVRVRPSTVQLSVRPLTARAMCLKLRTKCTETYLRKVMERVIENCRLHFLRKSVCVFSLPFFFFTFFRTHTHTHTHTHTRLDTFTWFWVDVHLMFTWCSLDVHLMFTWCWVSRTVQVTLNKP